jgi:YidC/Oxa1 family membrane protein insertase
LGAILFNMWQTSHVPSSAAPTALSSNLNTDIPSVESSSVPSPSSVSSASTAPASIDLAIPANRLVEVNTDVYHLWIDLKGGNIVKAQLRKYPQTKNTPHEGYRLLDHSPERFYVAQSGLINIKGPDNQNQQAIYTTQQPVYNLDPNQKQLAVDLKWTNEDGVQITKTFVFNQDSYVVDVKYHVVNPTDAPFQAKLFGQLKRTYKGKTSSGMIGVQMYQGGAVYTPDKPFTKISFEKMNEEAFSQNIKGGWAAYLEHYFLSAWLPDQHKNNQYYTKAYPNNQFAMGTLTDFVVPAKQDGTIGGRFFIGPEKTDVLKQLHSGLDLTVDYGILWPISQVIFKVLQYINAFVGNWGVAIILVTLLIKLLFFKLSASSYRSMGKIREAQPQIEAIKARCGDDKQKMSQAVMELYRKEKINPLGGCLPILIQIPVFIALYYVLLESVELRQAPFMLWIQDLSSKDPYYILPIIMGITMLVQQKMNPTPPDPVQAKMMMLMPIIFTALFLSFPAGLVLYWVVNNVLSMAQQALIMHNAKKVTQPKKK